MSANTSATMLAASHAPGSIGDPAFRHRIERIYSLGPRPVGELVCEILAALAPSKRAFINSRLEVYANLDPRVVRALGADQFPVRPLRVVGGGR